MSRYSERFIKCSDAIEAATDVIVDHDGSMSISYVKDLSVAIEALPSIDLVRCKECKRRTYRATEIDDMGYCNKLLGWTKDTDFCSWGERSSIAE